MDGLEILNLQQRFTAQGGNMVTALDGVSFSVGRGEIVALLGASGCGKTSLLHIVAGFARPTAGDVRFGGAPLAKPDGRRAVVFQQPALFGWLTVQQNVAFGLKRRHIPALERKTRVEEMLALVGLSAFARAYPHELSGGMQQRAALARALVLRPEILLMDEPFAALDALLRRKMQQLLLDVWRALELTILFVTHDVDEALRLAHRVVVLTSQPGRVAATIVLPGAPNTRTEAGALDAQRAQICAALAFSG